MSIILADKNDYYNGMYTEDKDALEIYQVITNLPEDRASYPADVDESDTHSCVMISEQMDDYRQAAGRLGFAHCWIGFTDVQNVTRAEIIGMPQFIRLHEGLERITFRMIVDISYHEGAVSTVIADVDLFYRHDEQYEFIASHRIKVEQVYTTYFGQLRERCIGVDAREQVGLNPLYFRAARVVMAMFVRLDDRVLTPSVTSRVAVDAITG